MAVLATTVAEGLDIEALFGAPSSRRPGTREFALSVC